MSLTIGGGPLATRPTGDTNYTIDGPPHRLWWHDWPRRIRGEVGGETIVDTRAAKMLHESNLLPVLYMPEADIRADLVEATDTTTHCPFKGDAAYWTIRAGSEVRTDAIWGYDQPLEGAPPLAGYRAFVWDAVDTWYEEDEVIVGHVRDPFHRVDPVASSRHVVVRAGDAVVADSDRPVIVFETGLPPRYYLPRGAASDEALEESDTRTICPYKGIAAYHHLRAGDAVIDDAVWSYRDPRPGAAPLAGLLSFDPSKVTVEVDGEVTD